MENQTVGQFTVFVGKRIAAKRKKKGMSMEVLARKIGVSKAAMGRMELGQGNISLEQLMRLARYLAPTEELLGLPHYSDEEMAEFVNKRVLGMSEEELRAWKQNTGPSAADRRHIFILDDDAEAKSD